MLTIKLSLPGFGHPDISQFTGTLDNTFRDCVFYINRDDILTADFWVCLEGPYKSLETCRVNRNNVIYLAAEVAWPRFFYDSVLKRSFLSQFGKVYTCHDVYADNAIFGLPYLPWMINANHGQSIFAASERDRSYFSGLTHLPKTKQLSVFCSAQAWTDDHKMRLKFVKALKKHFGDTLDWFGNGIRPLDQKWDGIAPYKYHLVLENQSRFDVITEKLYDAFLGLAYPIYYGAPNVGDYFDPSAIATINILDLHGSIKKIEQILAADPYQAALPALVESKNRVLTKYNLFERIVDLCQSSHQGSSTEAKATEQVVLKPLAAFDVVNDFKTALEKRQYQVLFNRLAYYYSGHLLQRLGNKLLGRYNSKDPS
jgi:hypothetical protein